MQKLRLLHDFYRPADREHFQLTGEALAGRKDDVRDYIYPDCVEKYSDYLKLGERYVRVFYLKDYASYLQDKLIYDLLTVNSDLVLSMDMLPVPKDEAVREVEQRVLGEETNIANWQRRQNRNNNFSAVVPYDLERQRSEATLLLDDVANKEQRLMLCVMTLGVTADSKEELELLTKAVVSAVQTNMCQIAVLKYQQLDGLNTVLPIGTRRIDAFRTLTSKSASVLMPFTVQEIQDRSGIYFGENAETHNLIMVDRANLMNQSSIILGVPGSGKSLAAKQMMACLLLNTDDDVLVCDPEGEYGILAKELCPEDSAVIRITAGGRDKLNAMEMEEGYGDLPDEPVESEADRIDPIATKSQFILSLLGQIAPDDFGSAEQSLIDRCVRQLYEESVEEGFTPTLRLLRKKLLDQAEPEARRIALALELFTEGSLNIFGGEANADLNKRIVVFDIHNLGEQLKPTGLLVITDTILNRVSRNWQNGIRTHVFIDEFHVVFSSESSKNFFDSAWKMFRKRNACPTAITQNVDFLLSDDKGRSMVSNSEFMVMLNQSEHDRNRLAVLLNISDEQLHYVENAEAGCGLIRYGAAVIPFKNRLDPKTKLYELMSTKPGEGRFGGRAS